MGRKRMVVEKMKIDGEALEIMQTERETGDEAETMRLLKAKYGDFYRRYHFSVEDVCSFADVERKEAEEGREAYFLRWLLEAINKKYKPDEWADRIRLETGDFYFVESKNSYIFVKVKNCGTYIFWFSKQYFELDVDMELYEELKEVV